MGDDQVLNGIWTELSKVAVKGAQYNSSERQPYPECLQGTRVDLLKYIHELLDDPKKNQLIWLHGTAGVGKSAVAFTVADKMRYLKMTKETTVEMRLAGTFFFSREHTKRCTAGYFFATLVYQLLTNFPSIRKDVCKIIHDNRGLLDPDTPLCDQMRVFFLRPLQKLQSRLKGCPPLSFVIDALDECTPEPEVKNLILCLARALREPDLPVTHILLTSRSETYISEVFRDKEVCPLVREIPVRTSGEGGIISLDGADIDNDICTFLGHSFKELGRRHPDFPQPSQPDLAKLASRAGGRFIVASTMMKFIISDEDEDPCDRLQLMLELTSELLPGTEVYRLYDRILFTCTDPKRAYMHLSIIAALADPLPMLRISTLLGPGLGRDVQTTLIQLRSFINIPTDSTLPVSIYHSSIRDYVSDPSNCGLSQVRGVPSPHSLLARSALRLMTKEIPKTTALLDALLELKKQSKAMQPEDPHMLKYSLAFLVQPSEPLSAVICMLWLRGDRNSDIQSWLGTVDGRAWLQTWRGQEWLRNEAGRKWLRDEAGREWLRDEAGREWLRGEGGREWLRDKGGREWLRDEGGREWLQTQKGREWLQAQEGRHWLRTVGGLDWLRTEKGREWLRTEKGLAWPWTKEGRDWRRDDGGREWLRAEGGRDWLRDEGGRQWLQTQEGQHWLQTQEVWDWLRTEKGREWLRTQEGWEWLRDGRGRQWLRTMGGRKWFRTMGGREWLRTIGGRDWLWTQAGSEWLRDEAGREWLQTLGGREWLRSEEGRWWLWDHAGREWSQTRAGQDWLQTQAGRDWLQTREGRDWRLTQAEREWSQLHLLPTQGGLKWLQTHRGQEWLKTERGREWLQTERGRNWLRDPAGRNWLQTQAGRDWLQTREGGDWLQTQEGWDWLQTQEGREWLQTPCGHDWLMTPHGRAWQSTPMASVWVTIEEFLTTLEATNDIVMSDVPLLPAFQVIQQFKTLPDFLMFPVFLALRHQHHSTSALPQSCLLPDRQIIDAISTFANEVHERTQVASDALKYACHNWVIHLSRAPRPWDKSLDCVFQAFQKYHTISWLEMEWCLKGLRSCIAILSEGQNFVKSMT